MRPQEDSANLTLGENEDLDFSDLKRKKKKKAVALDLEDVDSGTATPTAVDDEFADLKKKKKGGKKKAFDLEAFERELAEEEGKGPGVGSDDENAVANEDAPEDGLFAGGEEAEQQEKSKAQLAADKKAWLSEPERDYKYEEVCDARLTTHARL